jgi:hypothetical protein
MVLRYPLTLGGVGIASIRDLTIGFETHGLDKVVADSEIFVRKDECVPSLPSSSSSEMITFECVNGCVVTLRTRCVYFLYGYPNPNPFY